MKKGLTLMPPRSNRSFEFCSVVGKPPFPLPMTTPMRSSSSVETSRPASSRARPEAATANCENLAIRRTSLRSAYCWGSKPVTSPAIRQGNCAGSQSVKGPIPDRPLTRPSQYSSTDWPNGDTKPMPVTTTLLLVPFRIRGLSSGPPTWEELCFRTVPVPCRLKLQ